MITMRKFIAILKATLLKGLVYSLAFGALVWVLIFGVSLLRLHILGHAPDGILWLTPQHMPWPQALEKSARVASVAAIVMVWFGIAATLLANLIGLIIIGLFLVLPKRSEAR